MKKRLLLCPKLALLLLQPVRSLKLALPLLQHLHGARSCGWLNFSGQRCTPAVLNR